jgi:hypothetical protein
MNLITPPRPSVSDATAAGVSRSATSDLRKPQTSRFAVEVLLPERLIGAFLEFDEQRYGSGDIRRLYESAHPLTRRMYDHD